MNKDTASLGSALYQLSTEQLDAALAEELHKEVVDDDKVRLILEILREREKDMPVTVTPEIQSAWEKYQKDSAGVRNAKPRKIPTWLIRAASVCVVILLLFATIPQQAQADNFWERLVRWTDDVFEFFDPHGKEAVQDPYVFQTDNPGLQKVYDKVVGLGITEPVVPMWLPEGYELIEVKDNSTSTETNMYFRFSNKNSKLTFYLKEIESKSSGQYQKDDTQVNLFEIQGSHFYIMQNIDLIMATWSKDNIECCLSMEGREDVVYKILKSIYSMEDSE